MPGETEWELLNDPSLTGELNGDPASDEYGQKEFAAREISVFAIDARKDMHYLVQPVSDPDVPQIDEKPRTAFQLAVRAVRLALETQIITREQDLFAVFLYNTRQQTSSYQPGVATVFAPKKLAAEDILLLHSLETGAMDVERTYGVEIDPKKETLMNDLVDLINMQLGKVKIEYGHRNVFFITNNDSPCGARTDIVIRMNKAFKNRMRQFRDANISAHLLSIQSPPEFPLFDVSKWWENMILSNTQSKSLAGRKEDLKHTNLDFDQLTIAIQRRVYRKRAQYRIPFHVTPTLDIGVIGYYIIKEQTTDQRKIIDGTTNNVVNKIETTSECQDTGASLLPEEMYLTQKYGQSIVTFTNEEYAKIKVCSEDPVTTEGLITPGITLLCFKHLSSISDLNIGHATFIRPDDSVISGSSAVFVALLEGLVERERVAICRFLPGRNTIPRLVALVPQREERDESSGTVVRAAGFNVIRLPYRDDIRMVSFLDTAMVPDSLTEKYRQLVKNFKVKWEPYAVENPHVQLHYEVLKNLAVDVHPENIHLQEPGNASELFDNFKRKSAYFTAIKTEVESTHLIETLKRTVSQFQENTSDNPHSASSKRRAVAPVEIPSIETIREYVESQFVGILKIDQLKAVLREMGVVPKGKRKAELVQEVIDKVNGTVNKS